MSTIGLIILLLVILWTTTTGFQTSFILERDSSSSMVHTQLVARDEARQLSKILGLPIYGPKGSGWRSIITASTPPPVDINRSRRSLSIYLHVDIAPKVGSSNIFQGMTDSLKDAIEVSYLPKTSFEEGTPDYFNYVKELHL